MPAVSFRWNWGPSWELGQSCGVQDHSTFLVGRWAAQAEGPCFPGPGVPPTLSYKNIS